MIDFFPSLFLSRKH